MPQSPLDEAFEELEAFAATQEKVKQLEAMLAATNIRLGQMEVQIDLISEIINKRS